MSSNFFSVVHVLKLVLGRVPVLLKNKFLCFMLRAP